MIRPAALGLALIAAAGCRDRPTAPTDSGPPADARAPAAPPPSRIALLVGVSRYADPGVAPVPGARRDLDLVRGLLTDRYGFTDAGIVTLRDAEATAEGIERAFRRHLIEQARPGTTAVFHFSGHGRQVPDRSGDEVDGRDEALVPYDAAADSTAGSLLDDDIGRWLDDLQARGADVTVIVDACHSGSPTRGERMVRVAPAVELPAADQRDAIEGFGLDGAPAASAAPGRPVGSLVVLSAARSDQVAQDARSTRSGESYGALTWALTRTLSTAPAGATWRDVIGPVRHAVARIATDQTPQLSGPVDRVIFGATDRVPPPGSIPVIGGADGPTLAAGGLHGVVEGSVWRLQSPDGHPLGRATVVGLSPLDARLGDIAFDDPALRAAETPWNPTPGTRAVEQARPLRAEPVSLGFDGPPPVAAALRGVGFEPTGGAAPLRLRVSDGAARFEWLDGRPLGDPLPVDAALSDAAWLWARWSRLVWLEGGAPSRVSLELRGARRAADGWRVAPGDAPHIVVRNTDPKWVWYVTLLALSEDGDVAQLWPPLDDYQKPDAALTPGREVRVPESQPLTVALPGGRRHMVDVIKLIATRSPVDFGPVVRGDKDTARHPLVDWLSATRGASQGLLDDNDWGVETLWVHTCAPADCPE